jgi:DNA invertase Pin-like site-specific DNA recombinase
MKRAVMYLRVSTVDQTTANQDRELRAVADRAGWEVVKVYRDHGISGTKGREKRPAFDALHRDAARRQFDVVMAWPPNIAIFLDGPATTQRWPLVRFAVGRL